MTPHVSLMVPGAEPDGEPVSITAPFDGSLIATVEINRSNLVPPREEHVYNPVGYIGRALVEGCAGYRATPRFV